MKAAAYVTRRRNRETARRFVLSWQNVHAMYLYEYVVTLLPIDREFGFYEF